MHIAVNIHLLVSFVVTVAVIIAVPGPSVMFIVGRALAVGRPSALAAAAGSTIGGGVQGLLAVLGFGSLITQSPMVYAAIKLAGAAYLLRMGVQMLQHRQLAAIDETRTTSGGHGRDVRRGFVVGVSNPKLLLFFAAVLPQFVDPSRGYVVMQMLVLVTVFTLISLLGESSWAMAGSSLRHWTTTAPRRIECVIGAGGLCVIGFGVLLAL